MFPSALASNRVRGLSGGRTPGSAPEPARSSVNRSFATDVFRASAGQCPLLPNNNQIGASLRMTLSAISGHRAGAGQTELRRASHPRITEDRRIRQSPRTHAGASNFIVEAFAGVTGANN
jgi:hypothetical protein